MSNDQPNPKSQTLNIGSFKYWGLIGVLLTALIALIAGVFVYFLSYDSISIKVGNTIVKAEIADTLPKQIQGLSDRESLCAQCGMLFVYEQPQIQTYLMRRMRFPLDIIFIRDRMITEIYENLPHPRMGEDPAKVESRAAADGVLEVNAGFVRTNRIKVGDRASY